MGFVLLGIEFDELWVKFVFLFNGVVLEVIVCGGMVMVVFDLVVVLWVVVGWFVRLNCEMFRCDFW